MSCQTFDYNGTPVTILCGPEMREVKRESEGVKWCFKCRKRNEFFHIVMAPVDLFSYYGPHAEIRCGSCDAMDADLFPGWSREWTGD